MSRTSFGFDSFDGGPLRGVKGVKPPMEFGEMTQDCFPGHAGKKPLLLTAPAPDGQAGPAAFGCAPWRISCCGALA